MDVNVGIDVGEDGSGTVTVAIGVDDDLLSRVPGAADRVHLDDLKAAGWEVTGPAKEADGNTWVHLSHPFANPTEMKELLAEINGPGGPLGAFGLEVRDEWDEKTWVLTGTAGLTGGIASFVDPDLAAAFGASKPLEQLVQESGVPVEQGLNLTVTREHAPPEGSDRRARAPRRARGADPRRDPQGGSEHSGRSDRRGHLRRTPRRLARVLGHEGGAQGGQAKGPLHQPLMDSKHAGNAGCLPSKE